MKLAAQDGSRLVARASIRGSLTPVALRRQAPYTCRQCQHTTASRGYGPLRARDETKRWQETRREFSWTVKRRQDEPKKAETDREPSSKPNGTIHATQHKQLPSRREEIRWRASKYMNQAMDDLMPKLAVASQRINTYTGTDYSAIESLRKEIREQGTTTHDTPPSYTTRRSC